MFKFKILIVVFSLFLILGCSNNRCSVPSQDVKTKTAATTSGVQKVGTKVGDQAPDFILKDLSGKTYKLSDFHGKYVFVDFWGTWCPPCIESLPDIKNAYDSLDKNKVAFISICSDCDDLAEFLQQNDLPWLQLIADTKSKNDFSVSEFPTPYLIGPQGKILAEGNSQAGYKSFSNPKKLIESFIH